VCLGNIVRSPLAENLFLQLAEKDGKLRDYEVDSAGIGNWHLGEPPDARMRRVAARRGLIYEGRARQFQYSDFSHFDLIVAMDFENRRDLLQLARRPEDQQKIHTLREFDPYSRPKAAVPDPYYGGIDGFEDVYDIVERSIRGLLEALDNGLLK
jgi:protein-tyrosine phosphatase